MPSLIEELSALREAARGDVAAANTEADLEALRVKYLGKKGSLSAALAGMRNVPADEKKAVGAAANEARDEVESLLSAAVKKLANAALEAELAATPIDVTLPGRRGRLGRRHPLSRTLDEMVDVFRRLGFTAIETPHIEADFYNFEALNFPKDHPARDMQDTFFIDGTSLGATGNREDVLLRTHTSSAQVRAMLSRPPPIRVINAGSVFRKDEDPTHSPMFHQIECLFIDRNVSFADLKGTLDEFVRAMFGAERKTRFRPSFFPFVEPGAEVDISCTMCGGSGQLSSGTPCRTCKTTGWLEVLGAGMVHPNVLKFGGVDPEVYSGFAFGLGVERMAMLKYGIDDLGYLFQNDARFLEQFT